MSGVRTLHDAGREVDDTDPYSDEHLCLVALAEEVVDFGQYFVR